MICEGDLFRFVFIVVCFMVRIVALYLVFEVVYCFIREVVVAGDV
jgi:hypothetical protein